MIKKLALLIAVGAAACADEKPTPEARLEQAASQAARFLAGYESFAKLDLADSVDLYIAPDGGGDRVRMARAQLADRNAWQVQGIRRTQSFVPTGMRTRLVPAVGKYMNCMPSDMRTRFPQLASSPHVGVKLEPPNAKSCLEAWSLTFVYDTTGGRTRLIAAIYDQWEW